jgi:spermidine/putrescine transport system substrate-binding protein
MVRASMSRRSMLRGASLSAFSVAGAGLLGACGTPSATQTEESCQSEDLSDTEKVLDFSNWPAYMDQKRVKQGGKKVTVLPTLQGFEDEFGIDVNYVTDVNDNSEFFEKVRAQLAACEPVERDLFVLTDWMAAKMIDLGWLQKLDKANMPNVEANLTESLKGVGWDPNRDYSVPWQSGLTGIAYNEDLTGEVRSFEELLSRPDLKGQVTLLSEMRDTMLFMLLTIGADPSDFTDDEWGQAIDALQKSVDDGQVRAFNGNNYLQDLVNGNVAACEAWSGDVIITQYDNPNIKWVVPEEGVALWSDNMLVPNRASHKTNAEMMMDYYYDPEVAATLAAWVNYICPVDGAQQAMEKIDPSLVDNPLIFPDEQMMAKTRNFMALDETKDREYQEDFAAVTGG